MGITPEYQLTANKRYIQKLDIITIKIPKEDGEKIRQAAKDADMSLTQYIMSKLKN